MPPLFWALRIGQEIRDNEELLPLLKLMSIWKEIHSK